MILLGVSGSDAAVPLLCVATERRSGHTATEMQ